MDSESESAPASRHPRAGRPGFHRRNFGDLRNRTHRESSAEDSTETDAQSNALRDRVHRGKETFALRGSARFNSIEQRHRLTSSPRFARGVYEHQPSYSSGDLELGMESGNADALRPEYPDCEGTFLRQLAGLPAQGCSTDHLPARPVAGRTVALLSIDGPRMWDQPITAARPRRNWREPLSAPHFPFHPAHCLGRSTDCTTGV